MKKTLQPTGFPSRIPIREGKSLFPSGGKKLFLSLFLMFYSVFAFSQLNGVKTIDAAGSGANNYTTFTLAVNALIAQGVNGPVTFNVAKGTYIESLTFPAITGASSTNRITFQSASGVAADVWLGDNVASVPIVKFNSSSYITFQNMTVRKQTVSLTASRCFELAATSPTVRCVDIRIIGCIMQANWGSGVDSYCIKSIGNNDSLKVKKNTASNCAGLVSAAGNITVGAYMRGLEVDSNTINNTNNPPYNGIGSITYQVAPKIRYNDVLNIGFSGTGPVALQVANISGAMDISYNKTQISDGNYGFDISNVNINAETTPALIYNNFIEMRGPNGTKAAVYIRASNYLNFYHNSIYQNGTAATNTALRIDGSATHSNINIQNNQLFSNLGLALDIQGTSAANIKTLNYNNYFNNSGGAVINRLGTTYTSVAAFAGTVYTTPSKNDENSIQLNPNYTLSTPYDLRVGIYCANGANVGVTNDILGTARIGTYAIGAHQPTQLSNDIGVDAIISPSAPFSIGSHNIVVRIRNYGSNNITSAQISYSVNGGPAVTQSLPSTLGSCDTMTIVFSGGNAYNFPGGVSKIKVSTSNPNSGADANGTNDSKEISLCLPLNGGTYTINPAGSGPNNFTSFGLAADQMNCAGITGPVVFLVAPGTYTEQVILGAVTGASSVNTIQFIGASRNSVILTYAGTTTADIATLRLNGSQWVTFRDMTIRATGTVGWAVNLLSASNNNIKNCLVEITGVGATNTGTGYMGIILNGSATSYSTAGNSANNYIDSNEVNAGYYNIYCMTGGGTFVNFYRWNTLNNGYSAAAYFNSSQTVKFLNNTLSLRTSNANNDGIVLFNGNSTSPQFHEIKNNKIWNAGQRGIYMATSSGSSGSLFGEIVNNMIGGGFRATTPYGIYTTSSRWKYYHNTIYLNSPGTGNSRAYMQTTTGNNNIFVNNIFSVGAGNVNAIPVEFGAVANANIVDYNNYYNWSGNTLIRIVGVDYDVNTFKGIYTAGGGAGSINSMPVFVSPTDLHLSSTYDAPSGDFSVGVTTDIDGDVRCSGVPSIGADQSNFPQLTPLSAFVVSDSVYENSTTRIVNTSKGDPNQYTYEWYVDGLFASSDRNLDYNFTSAGIYSVSMVIRSCTGKDSSNQTVTVITPSSTPESDFIAEKQIVNLYEVMNLRDVSNFGPTNWEWSASPSNDAFFDPSNLEQNPRVFFGVPGFFDICLRTANGHGLGKDTCKNSYIFVKEDYNMCSSGTSAKTVNRYGNLFDDGGSANYTANRNCSFLIDPCATSVTLSFSQFALGTGASLTIYDGADASAPVLGTFSGTTIPAAVTATSGKMFIRWVTATTLAAGFSAEWKSVADATPAPTADFTFPDTLYTDENIIFTSSSTGNNLSYSWDFDPPFGVGGNSGGNKNFDTYSYGMAGTYLVKLRVNNCAGSNSITKAIDVIVPTSAPLIDFTVDKPLAPVGSILKFTNSTTQGPLNYRWEITPSLGVNVTPDVFAREISASFMFPGTYSVKLVAENSFGADSLIKTSYITIYDYCNPGVASLDGKIGISNVTFGAINNTTPAGTTSYSNYINNGMATVQKGGTYPISIARINTTDNMNRKVWIDWNVDGDFDDAGELVAYEPSSRSLVFNANIIVPRTATEGFTRMRVGVSLGNNANKPCGWNGVGEFEDYTVEVTSDKVLPVITLTGPATIDVEQWYQYVEPGFTATDNVDGNITANVTVISNVDSTTVGTYQVRYEVSDSSGNVAVVAIRTVNITADITDPQITLLGLENMVQTVKAPFTDPGATATDYMNRNFTSFIVTSGTVDINKVGSYIIHYEVTDLAGNKTTVSRNVTIVDDVAPVINKTGADPLFIEVKNPFTEPGVSATDNYDASVIVNTSNVNTNVTGTYTVTYTAVDTAGNITTETRTVIVRDTEAPVIKLNGLDTVIVNVFGNYNEMGTDVSDNYCDDLTAVTSTVVNTNRLGDYLVNYNVTDCEGNTALTKTRLVRVVDRVAPELQLKGLATTTRVMRWSTYVDAGVTFDDNYYSEAELEDSLKVTTNVNTAEEGLYEYCYDLVDPSGNRAKRECRQVEVVGNTTGSEQFTIENSVNVFPNPTSGELNISVKFEQAREVKITIVNVLGEVVATINPQTITENNFKMDISSLAPGMYMVRIESNGMTAVKKVSLVN